MTGSFFDRVKETSTTTGTGNFTLAGAVTGYYDFGTAFGPGVSFKYCIEAVDGSGVPTGQWEVGVGYLLGDNITLVRDIVRTNSDETATQIDFSSGSKFVFNPFTGLSARKSTHGFDLQYGMP